MLTVVTSGKAAPGVTTCCWALALAWPRWLLVADCDPAGGDMAAGLLVGRVSGARGLLSWSSAARRCGGSAAAASMLPAHATEIPEQPSVWFVPGFATATAAESFTEATWTQLASALACCTLTIGRDALVDLGRVVGHRASWPLLRAADRVLVAVRPSVRSVHAAQEVITRLRYELGDLAAVSAVVIGDGPYPAGEVTAALEIKLAGQLPTDRQTAAALSDGAALPWRVLQRSPLLKSARALAGELCVERGPSPAAATGVGSR